MTDYHIQHILHFTTQFSELHVFSDCDENIYIRQLQTLTLTSKQYPFHYLAGIHCHFNIRTRDDYYLRVAVTTMDISGGSECSSAHLEIGDLGKFCSDSPPPASTVIQASNVSLNFVTGATVQGKGFQITVKSVGMHNCHLKWRVFGCKHPIVYFATCANLF